MTPTYLSKFNTFAQIFLVVTTIYGLATGHISEQVINGLIIFVLLTTVSSGLQYTSYWGRRAIINFKQDNYKDYSDDD